MGRNAFWWPSIFSIVCACIFTNISWMNFLEWIMYEGFKFEKDFTTLCPCPVSTLIHKCQVINIKRLWSLTRSQKPNLVLTYFLPSFETQKWKYDTKCNFFLPRIVSCAIIFCHSIFCKGDWEWSSKWFQRRVFYVPQIFISRKTF